MQEKLKEMILVVRPTQGNGLIPLDELETILQQLGYDFLISQKDEVVSFLDSSGSGFFYQDELVEYLYNNQTLKYTDTKALREAILMFDYDNDGKIKFEEFEYFMNNFGETENSYMDDAKIQTLLECCKPLDAQGNVDVNTLLDNINSCWQLMKKGK